MPLLAGKVEKLPFFITPYEAAQE